MAKREPKMEKLLELFHDVVRDDDIKDIVFSQKTGYLLIGMSYPGEADCVEMIETPEEIADILMDSLRNHFFELAKTKERLPKFSDRNDSDHEEVMTPQELSMYNRLIRSYQTRINAIING